MTTETIQTEVGKIPSPSNWANNAQMYQTIGSDTPILPIEKQDNGQVSLEDISSALDEYKRLLKAGIASKAEIMTLSRAFPNDVTFSKAVSKLSEGDAMVLGGPASVELIDREGHLITTDALNKAFDKYMANFRTRNTMVLHSDVQVGWALPAYITRGGQIFKSGVGEKGLFFITELRDDTKIAQRVMDQVNEGKLRSYSIAGSATKTQNMQKGLQPYMQVDEMELAEVTVCEKGVNQSAGFDILKAEGAVATCIDGSCLVQKQECDGSCFLQKEEGKITQPDSGYRNATDIEMKNGIMCGACKFFNKQEQTCDIVEGMIEDHMYCKVFAPLDESPTLEEGRELTMLMEKADGSIDFTGSFLEWMEKQALPTKKMAATISTLLNVEGRRNEHDQLLREYGFPSAQPFEAMRYTPVVETETDAFGIPMHIKPPWVVNEAGEHLGTKLDSDASTYDSSIAAKAHKSFKSSMHPWYSTEIKVKIPVRKSKSSFSEWLNDNISRL
jgi:HK97 family phage prohead protease